MDSNHPSDQGAPPGAEQQHQQQQQQADAPEAGRSGEGADSALRQLISEAERQQRHNPDVDPHTR